MNLIASVDRNWAIGCRGRLLASIPADKQMFRQKTEGRAVILGRRTLRSLPGGQPLSGRTNVVLSRNPDFRAKVHAKSVLACGSVEETLRAVEGFAPEDVFVIGGQKVFEAFLPYCDTAFITYIDYAFHADTYLRNLDHDPEWEMEQESDELTYFNLCYTFRRYRRFKDTKATDDTEEAEDMEATEDT